MKKSLVALAVLGTLAGTAAAQSSVTLFGVVDLAARYTEANGQSLSTLAASGISSSRFGVRGEEDLGGGLKAGFWLESSIGADAGSAGAAGSFGVVSKRSGGLSAGGGLSASIQWRLRWNG